MPPRFGDVGDHRVLVFLELSCVSKTFDAFGAIGLQHTKFEPAIGRSTRLAAKVLSAFLEPAEHVGSFVGTIVGCPETAEAPTIQSATPRQLAEIGVQWRAGLDETAVALVAPSGHLPGCAGRVRGSVVPSPQ